MKLECQRPRVFAESKIILKEAPRKMGRHRRRSFELLLIIVIASLCFGNSAHCAEAKSNGRSASDLHTDANAGMKLSPVPLNLHGRDPALVGRGSYLVNVVGGCGDCHSYPKYLRGGDPFQGEKHAPVAAQLNTKHYLAGGFCLGSVMSSNITPDADTGDPANLTLQQFDTVMRTGVAPDSGSTLLHEMPWPNYHNMSARDIKAIYEYLSAIPHAEPCNNSCPPKYRNTPDCPQPAPPQ
ncbi:MAG: cytochrome C [Candidatus Binataceae bacterium]